MNIRTSNLLQRTILTSVSRVSKGTFNIFMVGDVKQSIYRFRLSRPELFMEKFHTYDLKDSKTQRIDLHKNFRSRPEVLSSVNQLFRQIMAEDLAGSPMMTRPPVSRRLFPGIADPRRKCWCWRYRKRKNRKRQENGSPHDRRQDSPSSAGGKVTDKETGNFAG